MLKLTFIVLIVIREHIIANIVQNISITGMITITSTIINNIVIIAIITLYIIIAVTIIIYIKRCYFLNPSPPTLLTTPTCTSHHFISPTRAFKVDAPRPDLPITNAT